MDDGIPYYSPPSSQDILFNSNNNFNNVNHILGTPNSFLQNGRSTHFPRYKVDRKLKYNNNLNNTNADTNNNNNNINNNNHEEKEKENSPVYQPPDFSGVSFEDFPLHFTDEDHNKIMNDLMSPNRNDDLFNNNNNSTLPPPLTNRRMSHKNLHNQSSQKREKRVPKRKESASKKEDGPVKNQRETPRQCCVHSKRTRSSGEKKNKILVKTILRESTL